MTETIRQASDRIRLWREKPHVFVRECFGVTPDAWQDEVLAAFPTQKRLALKACKGPGKTTVLAWLAWNFLATRPHPKIAATSITADNLRDGLWTEMAKWQAKSPLLQEAFEWQKERIISRDHPQTWWMSARTWPRSANPQQQADTLAGLHADYLLFMLDESGGIPDAVMAAAEAGLASGVESHLVQAGNPTHLEGPLYRACTSERHLWHVTEISSDPDDPKRTPRVSIEWAREQIQKYGRDNPWVLVNVFGRFPPSSLNTLIGPDEVTEAMKRQYESVQYEFAPRLLGVDVARFGDDSSVIQPRQGLRAFPPTTLRNVGAMDGAGAVARLWNTWGADACMIDSTGGYGAGWVDALRALKYRPREVEFAGRPSNEKYANKRAEMWFEMCEWIKRGGALPNLPELVAELSTPTYSFKGDRLLLEDKGQIKQRLGHSPDYADALACTFAFDVPLRDRTHAPRRHAYAVM